MAILAPELVGALDVLFIDEAGQVGLPGFIAAAPSARSIALIGDPQQLGQPSAASHPEDAGLSCLEFVFDGAAVVPSDRGILLPVTHRMHPDIANWISDSFYRSQLHAHAKTRQQVLTGASSAWLNGSGLRVCAVEHAHNSIESSEEARAILQIVTSLTSGARWVDDSGTKRDITLEDIVIVAPFNRQVGVLRQVLPVGARIGTVDKFQGQEAAVAIWSVTSSSRDDAPRGLDFLLSPNRMNVAISRARAVAIVVMNPGLLATAAQNAHEMHLINALCLLAERATTQRA